jgi:uncharacterized membrane-anchored protein YhcB (DUF1043 family)
MFLAVFEFLIYILLAYGLVTQVVIPLQRGTLLFPAFRKRRKLEQKVEEVKEKLDEVKIEKTVEEIQNQIEKEKKK